MSKHSNYPAAVSITQGKWAWNEESLASNPLAAAHVAVVAGRGRVKVSQDLADFMKKHASVWSDLTLAQRWSVWTDIVSLDNPSDALTALHDCGWEGNFPELAAVRDVPQDPHWHPEGPVHVHLHQAADVAARRESQGGLDAEERQIAVLGALVHDLGKATHTQVHEDGRIKSIGHDRAGYRPAKSFLKSIGASDRVLRIVPVLVAEHMCHARPNPSRRALERLEGRLASSGATLEQLARVFDADTGGRGSASEIGVGQAWLDAREHYRVLDQKPPRPMMNGDFLRELGYKPGPDFGVVITEYRQSGLDLDEAEAARWVHARMAELSGE